MIGINKYFSTKIDTLCVSKNSLGIDLIINEEFWNSLKDDEQIAVLIHELHHIGLGHMFIQEDFSDKHRFNIAADLEVNSYIPNLPKGAMLPSMFELDKCLGTTEYYKKLPEDIKTIKVCLSSPGGGSESTGGDESTEVKTLDDHEGWKDFKDLSEAEQDLIKDSISSQLAKAYEQSKGTGNIPGNIKELIEDFLEKKPRVPNWKNLLKTNISSHIDTKFKKTYKRSSKRFDGSPGIKLRRTSNILVAVDTSGSVSDKELKEFFNEIHHISKIEVSVDVLEFDHNIHPVWPYIPNRDVTVHGRGGTSFKEPIEYFNQHHREYSMLIMFTDGECRIPDIPMHPHKMLWVITSNGTKQNYPGKAIYIPKI